MIAKVYLVTLVLLSRHLDFRALNGKKVTRKDEKALPGFEPGLTGKFHLGVRIRCDSHYTIAPSPFLLVYAFINRITEENVDIFHSWAE